MQHNRTIPRTCEQCGSEFLAEIAAINQGKARYCSIRCAGMGKRGPRIRHILICEQCGKTYEARTQAVTRSRRHFCSRACFGVANQTATRLNQEGYIITKRQGRTRLYHRLVMEQHLGRSLQPDEVVHHIDGDRLNNAIENLQVMTPSEHMSLHNRLRH